MRKIMTALCTTALLSVTLATTTTNIANARGSETVRLNGEGFRKCKAQGDSGYTAIVRGTSLNGTSRNGAFGSFNLRSCFHTRAEYSRFVNSIPHIVRGVNDIHYASCKARR